MQTGVWKEEIRTSKIFGPIWYLELVKIYGFLLEYFCKLKLKDLNLEECGIKEKNNNQNCIEDEIWEFTTISTKFHFNLAFFFNTDRNITVSVNLKSRPIVLWFLYRNISRSCVMHLDF